MLKIWRARIRRVMIVSKGRGFGLRGSRVGVGGERKEREG